MSQNGGLAASGYMNELVPFARICSEPTTQIPSSRYSFVNMQRFFVGRSMRIVRFKCNLWQHPEKTFRQLCPDTFQYLDHGITTCVGDQRYIGILGVGITDSRGMVNVVRLLPGDVGISRVSRRDTEKVIRIR